MNQIKLKRKIKPKLNKISLLIISIGLIIISVFLAFNYINRKISPILMNYASLESQKLSSIIINKAVSKHITEKISTDELFTVTTNSNGEIKAIDFNTMLVNKFLTETTNSVQINLRNIEKGNIDALEFSDSLMVDYDKKALEKGIIYEVNSGVVFNNALLANLGPKIPVKISLVGDAISNITTNVKNYGINSALIEVYVNIKINEKVILPFYNKDITVETKVPVALKIVTGSVPNYYANGLNQSTPSIIMPN